MQYLATIIISSTTIYPAIVVLDPEQVIVRVILPIIQTCHIILFIFLGTWSIPQQHSSGKNPPSSLAVSLRGNWSCSTFVIDSIAR